MANWKYHIDLKGIWDDESMPFERKRDEIVKRIRESDWSQEWAGPQWSSDPLKRALLKVEGAANEDEFDKAWVTVYDLADFSRAWIATF